MASNSDDITLSSALLDSLKSILKLTAMATSWQAVYQAVLEIGIADPITATIAASILTGLANVGADILTDAPELVKTGKQQGKSSLWQAAKNRGKSWLGSWVEGTAWLPVSLGITKLFGGSTDTASLALLSQIFGASLAMGASSAIMLLAITIIVIKLQQAQARRGTCNEIKSTASLDIIRASIESGAFFAEGPTDLSGINAPPGVRNLLGTLIFVAGATVGTELIKLTCQAIKHWCCKPEGTDAENAPFVGNIKSTSSLLA